MLFLRVQERKLEILTSSLGHLNLKTENLKSITSLWSDQNSAQGPYEEEVLQRDPPAFQQW